LKHAKDNPAVLKEISVRDQQYERHCPEKALILGTEIHQDSRAWFVKYGFISEVRLLSYRKYLPMVKVFFRQEVL